MIEKLETLGKIRKNLKNVFFKILFVFELILKKTVWNFAFEITREKHYYSPTIFFFQFFTNKTVIYLHSLNFFEFQKEKLKKNQYIFVNNSEEIIKTKKQSLFIRLNCVFILSFLEKFKDKTSIFIKNSTIFDPKLPTINFDFEGLENPNKFNPSFVGNNSIQSILAYNEENLYCYNFNDNINFKKDTFLNFEVFNVNFTKIDWNIEIFLEIKKSIDIMVKFYFFQNIY